MGIKIGVCGAGAFAGSFIPLFKAHPGVEEVSITDLLPDRADERARQFGPTRRFDSFQAMLRSDVDAVCIFTQRFTHAPLTLEALRAGKHVYCAVPIGHSVEEIGQIVDEVKRTGLIYQLGETSYYYGCTLYCRARHRRGDFGQVVYAEAQYLHDMSHGFYESFRRSGGADWKKTASFPPMWYPTHSVSMVTSVTGAHMTDVSCLGYVDRHEDGVFRADVSQWGNTFSNETGLMRMSDGAVCRINEFRRVGWSGGSSVHNSIYGTEGSYEEQSAARTWSWRDRSRPPLNLWETIRCASNKPAASREAGAMELSVTEREDFHTGMSAVHPKDRLPANFRSLPNGHEGSHQFLVDDFVTAVASAKHPPNHVWAAARYTLPGIIAHESAKRDGERLKIPDFGPPPAGVALLPETVGKIPD